MEAVSKALTGDLVVFRGKVHRAREHVFYGPDLTPTGRLRKHTQEILEPVEVEAHVNLLSLGVGAVAVGAVGLAAYLAWEGLTLGTPLGPFRVINGLKESPFWQTEASRARAALTIRRLRKGAASGEGTIPDPSLFDEDPCVVSEAVFNAETNAIFRAAMKAKAKKAGCAWAQ